MIRVRREAERRFEREPLDGPLFEAVVVTGGAVARSVPELPVDPSGAGVRRSAFEPGASEEAEGTALGLVTAGP